MTHTPPARSGLSLFLAASVVLAGCGHGVATQVLPSVGLARGPLPAEVRARMGTVGVVAAASPPGLEFQRVQTYSTAGAAAGLAQGFLLGLLGAAGCLVSMGYFAEACVIGLATPVLMIVGAKEGAEGQADRPAAGPEEVSLEKALAEARIPDVFRNRIIDAAAVHARTFLVPLPAEAPPSAEPGAPEKPPAAAGIETILETVVTGVSLRMPEGEEERLALTVGVQVRLVRAEDGTELASRSYEHREGAQLPSEWAAADAAPFRAALARAAERLAEDAVLDLFATPSPPEGGGADQEP